MRHRLNNKITSSLVVTIVAFGLLGVAPRETAADPFAKAKLTEQELIDGSKKEKALVFYCAFDIATIKMELKHFKAKYPWVMRIHQNTNKKAYYGDNPFGYDSE